MERNRWERAIRCLEIAVHPHTADEEVIADPHVAARAMLVEIPRTDGVEQPVLVPGNPVKMSAVAEHAEHRPPRLGEHTAAVLSAELGLTPGEIGELRSDGVIA